MLRNDVKLKRKRKAQATFRYELNYSNYGYSKV